MLLASKMLCHATRNVVEKLRPPRRLQREPILRAEYPWEAKGVYFQGSVLKDGGRFRMWYSAIGARRREQQYLACAESGDGLHWEKPLRREFAHAEWPETNVVYGTRFNLSAPNVHFYAAPRDGYRFFVVFDSRIEQHEFQDVPKVGGLTEEDRRRLMRHPNWTPGFDWDKYWPPSSPTCRAVYLADSRDGLHWEPPDARFAIPGQSDGDHTVVWDPVRRFYRMYLRGNRFDENGRRIRQVVTATSPDTLEWTKPNLCLESDAIDDPRVHQVHGMTVTWRDGLFIGLVQVMDILEEPVQWNPLLPLERARFHVQLAVSTDGVRFHRVGERREFFGTGEEGAFDCGMVRCGGQWVIDGDRMLMYYDGRPYPHLPPEGGDGCEPVVGIGVAESPLDRFAGLAPEDRTEPAEVVVVVPKGALGATLNAAVGKGGEITASLRHPDGCRVLTHTDEACEPVREGGLRVPLSWRGGGRWPEGEWHLRLRLAGDATVFAVNFS